MIQLKSLDEIDAIGRAGEIIARLFQLLPERIVPGTTTADLDDFAESFIRSHPGAEPAFKGLYGFPASLCTSINDEVVHGIPSDRRRLEEGDVISVDVGVRLDDWYADAARTFPVGEISTEAARLLETTEEALRCCIPHAMPGNRLGDIGQAIERTAENAGFSIVRDLVGHGIGRAPHEEPQVPNFGRAGRGLRLHTGLVLAIEPMLNEGEPGVRTLEDRWTVVTNDGRRSAHFENTVAVLDDGPRILTEL